MLILSYGGPDLEAYFAVVDMFDMARIIGRLLTVLNEWIRDVRIGVLKALKLDFATSDESLFPSVLKTGRDKEDRSMLVHCLFSRYSAWFPQDSRERCPNKVS